MLTVAEARERILASVVPVGTELVPLEGAAERVLARSVVADSDFPAFDNSSVDGFAVRSEEVGSALPGLPVRLPVFADIRAGSAPGTYLEPRTAARIMTGAPLPFGADAVVMQEDTDFRSASAGSSAPSVVGIFRAAKPAENVRRRGDDFGAGQVLLEQPRRLGPAELGLLAMLGHPMVDVFRRPRVAILSTGDELLPVDAPPSPGKIRESNSYALAALAANSGAEIMRLGIVRDERRAVAERLDQAVSGQADMILSTAGVSVGAYDYVREAIELHGSLDFWRVNMRPGKPLAFGLYRGVPFLGLPGNPVSAYVSFLVFVGPALARLCGDAGIQRATLQVRAGQAIESDGRESYLRARVEMVGGSHVAFLAGHQGSGNLYTLTRANALLIIPSGVKSVPPGEEVTAWLL